MRYAYNLIKDYSGFCEEARQRREKYGNQLEGYCNNPGKSGGLRLEAVRDGKRLDCHILKNFVHLHLRTTGL